MSDNKINKSSLKEAKANFEEIQNFAIEQATKNLQEDVSQKVIDLMNKTLNEDVTINIDSEGNVEVSTEGDMEDMDSMDVPTDLEDMDSELEVSDEDDEIEIDNSEIEEMENIQEMNFEEQDAMAAPAPAPAPAAEAPAEEMPMDPSLDAAGQVPVPGQAQPGQNMPAPGGTGM